MHGCAVVLAATWEASVASLALALLMASIAYCAGKLWKHERQIVELRGKHDKDIVELRTRILAIEKDCVRHQEWMTKIQDTTGRIDRTVAKIAGKLDVEVEPADP